MSKPRFTHDCHACHYLGAVGEYDLYVCPQGGAPTIVARYGNEGHEYKSGLSFFSLDGVIRIGMESAFDQGYLTISATEKLKTRPEKE